MDESFEALRMKRGDCVIASNLSAFYSIHKGKLQEIKIYDLELPVQTYAIAVNKTKPELLFNINIGLQNLKTSGEYDRIFHAWFGDYETESPTRIEYYIIGAILLIVIIILLIVTRKTKKKAHEASQIIRDIKTELELSFQAGKIKAWMYDIETQTIHSTHQLDLFTSGAPVEQFYDTMINNTADSFKSLMAELSENSKQEGIAKFCVNNENRTEPLYYEARVMRAFSHACGKYIIVGTLKDITVEVKAEQELIEMCEKAETSNRLKTAFLENMSHEIRTPLNAIVGFTEVINSSDSKNLTQEEREVMLNLIYDNSELLATLVNDVLDISLLESERFSLSFEQENLYQICDKALKTIATRVPEGVSALLEIPPTSHNDFFYTDKTRLLQVLGNFLANACKYTDQGNITLGYMHGPNGAIDFFVTDTGCGIPDEKAEVVFERFEKLDSFKQGTGLGLSVCRIIANLIKGKVYLDTSYKKGCRFVFTHPLIKP